MFMLNFKKEYHHPARNPLQISPPAAVADSEPVRVAEQQEPAVPVATTLKIPVSVAAGEPASDMAAARPARHPDVFRPRIR